MSKPPAFGPTIWAELAAAAVPATAVAMFVPLDVVSSDDSSVIYPAGTVLYAPGATPDQVAAVQKVVAAHDPTRQLPSDVSGDLIIGAIAKADRAKCDPSDIARIAWRDDVPTTNNKLARIAKAVGTTPDALRQAAQQP